MRDFLQNTEGDIDLSNSDIVMADATLQHERDILLTRPGALKHSPSRGVGIEDYYNDDSAEDLLRKTRQEMIKDGIKVLSIKKSNDKIEMEGYYEADYNS
jgi:hypothetical protein